MVIKISICLDEWFKQTRVKTCLNHLCRFYDIDSECCGLKEIIIGVEGKCIYHEMRLNE